MSLINRILPACNVAVGESKNWASTDPSGSCGCRVSVELDEEGILRIDVVEWIDEQESVVMAIALAPTGEVLSIEGISNDEPAPITEFSRRLRAIVADMEEV